MFAQIQCSSISSKCPMLFLLMEADGLLLPLAVSTNTRVNSGGQKRKARNALPQVFIMVAETPFQVVGGFVAASAYVTAEDRCFDVQSGVCMLVMPMCISREMCSRSSGFFKLTAEMEVLARTSPAAGGHSLNAQFFVS